MNWYFWGAGLLVLHHITIHPELPWPDRIYQVKDILNPQSHEFYVALLLLFGFWKMYPKALPIMIALPFVPP